MFRLLMEVPRDICVAVSGGPDSMAALDFLRRAHNVTAIHFNHGTKHGADAEEFVVDMMRRMGVPLITGKIQSEMPEGESKENFWRQARYEFFKKALQGKTLVMAHTLDDAMETWIFTSLHGEGKLIPEGRHLWTKDLSKPSPEDMGMSTCEYEKKYSVHIIRPFLLSRKADMLDWCKRKQVPYVMDPGNSDVSYPRVRIRQVIMPQILLINPGFPKVISRCIEENKNEQGDGVSRGGK